MSIYKRNRHAHSVGWSMWHFEWCTKYRYKIFKHDRIKNFCVVAIQEAAKKSKRYPRGHLWSAGKFAASIGHITLEKAKAYLEAHHAKASVAPVRESPL